MLRRQHLIAFVLVIVLVVILLKLPPATVAPLKSAISALFVPFFGVSKTAGQKADVAKSVFRSRKELLNENALLHRERDELRIRLMQMEAAAQENLRLREHLRFQTQTLQQPGLWKVRLGRVIGRDPANWWRTLQIDLGSSDGVELNQPVMTAEGLVGRISMVGSSRSQVLLLGDPGLRVGAVVQETRDTGVVLADGGKALDSMTVELGFLARTSQVKPGHTVLTSGDGGLFPPGILIGKVIDSRSANLGMSTEARVKLAANFSTLEEVWVKVQ